MKWKIATASVLAAAVMSAPVAAAAPGNSNANGNTAGPRNTIGKTISEIAKNGGGAAAIHQALINFKPNNKGLANALQQILKPKPTPTPEPTPEPTPTPTA